MANAQEDIWIRLKTIFDGSGIGKLDRELKKIQHTNKKLDDFTSQFHRKNTESWTALRRDIGRAQSRLEGFQMQWLSVMFFGMAMQRAFGGILRASFKTWNAVTEGTNKAGGAMTQLQAAWEFFKFSLFDALVSSGLFEKLVDIVLRLVEWWGNLSEKTKEFAGYALLAAAAIGAAMFAAGTIVLGVQGVSKVLSETDALGKQIKGMIGTIAIAYAFVQAADSFKDLEEGKWIDGLVGAIGAGLAGWGGIRILQGKKGGALIAVGLAFELVEQRKIFSTMMELFGAFIGFAKAIGPLIAELISAGIANDLVSNIQSILRSIANAIAGALPGMAKMIRKAASSLDPLKDSFTGKSTDEMINMIADGFVWGRGIGNELDAKLDAAIEKRQASSVAAANPNAPTHVIIDNVDQLKDPAGREYLAQLRQKSQLGRSGMAYWG
jgi:hypothetical protein